MTINDKVNVLHRLELTLNVVFELGCGMNKRHLEAIGIDALDYPCVDIVGDVFEVISRFRLAL